MRRFQIGKLGLLGHLSVITLIVGVLGVAAVGAQSTEDDPAQVEAGMAVFESVGCSGCHGVDGTGSNTGRPLIGIADQEPDRLVHIESVTNGKGNMPEWGTSLEPEEIDAAVSYLRLTFVAQEEAELAVTGRTTSTLFVAAFAALTAGLGLLAFSRRRELSH